MICITNIFIVQGSKQLTKNNQASNMYPRNFNIPRNQLLWVTHFEDGQARYAITSDVMRLKYYLYEVSPDGSLNKIETASTPVFKKMDKKHR